MGSNFTTGVIVSSSVCFKPPNYLTYYTCQSENNFTMTEANLWWIILRHINFDRCQTNKRTYYVLTHNSAINIVFIFTLCQKISINAKVMLTKSREYVLSSACKKPHLQAEVVMQTLYPTMQFSRLRTEKWAVTVKWSVLHTMPLHF